VVSDGRVISAWPESDALQAGISAWEARLRCPQAHFVAADPEKYAFFWERALEIASDYSPDLYEEPGHRLSLDLAGTEKLFGPAASTAQRIVERLNRERLQARAGIGTSKILARIAADSCANSVTEMTVEKMRALPVDLLPGIDARIVNTLHELGLETAGDLRAIPRRSFAAAFGHQGEILAAMMQGQDPDNKSEPIVAKSIVLSPVVDDPRELRAVLASLAESLGRELRRRALAARKVRVKIGLRTSREGALDAQSIASAEITFAKSLENATALDDDLLRAVTHAIARVKHPVRLVSLAAMHLCARQSAGQLPLPPARTHLLSKALDAIKDRHGELALTRASIAARNFLKAK
jgi:DNA polymerase-4